jgi:hypothetical protein
MPVSDFWKKAMKSMCAPVMKETRDIRISRTIRIKEAKAKHIVRMVLFALK